MLSWVGPADGLSGPLLSRGGGLALLCDLNAGHLPLDLRMESKKGGSATKKKWVWACLILKGQESTCWDLPQLVGVQSWICFEVCLPDSLLVPGTCLFQLGCSRDWRWHSAAEAAWLLSGAESSDSVLCSWEESWSCLCALKCCKGIEWNQSSIHCSHSLSPPKAFPMNQIHSLLLRTKCD